MLTVLLCAFATVAARSPAEAVGARPVAGGAAAQGGCSKEDPLPVPVGPEGVVPFVSPTFSWLPVEGVKHYVVLVVLETDETHKLASVRVEGRTSVTIPDLPWHTGMKWQVSAECGGTADAYSAPTHFLIKPPRRIDCRGLRPPSPLGPRGFIGFETPVFSWTPVDGASAYTLVVQNASTAQVVIETTEIYATTYTPPEPSPYRGRLVWTVNAESLCGSGPSSEGLRFFSHPTPDPGCRLAPVTLLGPDANYLGGPQPLFKWRRDDPQDSTTHFTVHLLRPSHKPLWESPEVPGPSYHTSADRGLAPGAYAWFVRSHARCGAQPVDSQMMVLRVPGPGQ